MKKGLLLILSLLSVACALCQQVSTSSKTERVDSTEFSSLINSYNRIIMAERAEVSLFKVDLLGPLFYALSGIDSNQHNVVRLSFEQKFKPEWSWFVDVEGRANKIEFTELRYRGGTRYYFNMQKRILKGKSANNFSANYVSARLNYKRRPPTEDNQISLDLLFGIQRRLWKYGFVDFDVGFENIIAPYEDRNYGPDLTASLRLGIAF